MVTNWICIFMHFYEPICQWMVDWNYQRFLDNCDRGIKISTKFETFLFILIKFMNFQFSAWEGSPLVSHTCWIASRQSDVQHRHEYFKNMFSKLYLINAHRNKMSGYHKLKSYQVSRVVWHYFNCVTPICALEDTHYVIVRITITFLIPQHDCLLVAFSHYDLGSGIFVTLLLFRTRRNRGCNKIGGSSWRKRTG